MSPKARHAHLRSISIELLARRHIYPLFDEPVLALTDKGDGPFGADLHGGNVDREHPIQADVLPETETELDTRHVLPKNLERPRSLRFRD